PTSGTLLMDGSPIRGPGADRGVVFQEYALLPWKTVLDNVGLGLKLRGVPKAERNRTARRYLKLTNLEAAEGKYPYELSGGMKQRAAVARTLANQPQIMLMDEPFAAVDAQTREILQFELLRIWDMRPMTMLFVTHSIEEAVLMGDRVVVLRGKPSTVFETIAVDLPRPRDRQTLGLPRFNELREHVWATLMDEARRAEFSVSS
ncbi:MAG: ABC transporter ATP-binding protein, partial [Stellaceae bacterium]